MTPPIEWSFKVEINDSKKAESIVSSLDQEERKLLLAALNKGKSKETLLKKLERERKTAAIVELERLGMKTDENVRKINAITFLDDKILIWSTPWAYENMKWGKWIFKKETNQHYYNFLERKAEAKNQWIVLPEKKDFINTLKALPGEYSENNWYQWWHILSIILWESRTGFCDNAGNLHTSSDCGFLGSVSEFGEDRSWDFRFVESGGRLDRSSKNDGGFVCRPLVKNS